MTTSFGMDALHLHSWGPSGGPPVLVVHGVTNTGARYRRLAEEMLPEVRVLAPDLRGHGLSTWEPPWSVEQHVADLLATLDAQGLDRVVVVGHSFGGLLSLHLAATAPGRVRRLVLLDPAVALPADRAEREAAAARADAGWATLDEARSARTALRPPHARATVEEDLATFLERGEDGRLRFRFSREAAAAAWGEMARPAPSLAGFPGEATLVTAERADVVTDALRASLRDDLGDRLTETGIDAGHMLFWDAPDEVAALIRKALV